VGTSTRVTHCKTLQHSCNTLQHSATHCNTLQHTATHTVTVVSTSTLATHCNTLQHTVTHTMTVREHEYTWMEYGLFFWMRRGEDQSVVVCSVLQCVAVCYSVLQCVIVCCSGDVVGDLFLISLYVRTHVKLYTHLCACVCVCACAHAHTRSRIHMHVYACVRTYVYI